MQRLETLEGQDDRAAEIEAQMTRKGSVPIARVAGWNAWKTADGKPYPMLWVSLIGIPGTPLNVPPHVVRSPGADVLFLMVRVGHETEDAAALLAVLEQQEEPTVFVMPSTDAEGVFWWSDDDPDGDPFPIQVVAKLPRPCKPLVCHVKDTQQGP